MPTKEFALFTTVEQTGVSGAVGLEIHNMA